MQRAIEIAENSKNEIPVGCVIVKDKKIISESANMMIEENSSIMHAEINAISQAIKKTNETYLTDCDLYVTKEPCLMCFGAILNARIKRVYFGAYDVKYGAMDYLLSVMELKKANHCVEIYGGIMEAECKNLLEQFFENLKKAPFKRSCHRSD